MSKGELKKALLRSKKNAIPSFDNIGWTSTSSLVSDIFSRGNETRFLTTLHQGLQYFVERPSQYEGKRISVTVEKIEGAGNISLWVYHNGTSFRESMVGRSIDSVLIPYGVERIRLKLESVDGTGHVYFKNIQLFEGELDKFEDNILVGNSIVERDEPAGRNLIPYSDTEKTSANEFLMLYDLAPIFNKYGIDQVYSLSMDLKSKDTSVNNKIQVYMQNGSSTKYQIGTTKVDVTTEYQRIKLEGIMPAKSGNSYNVDTRAMLALYGTYDTGNIPVARNVQLELGHKATPFEVYRSKKIIDKERNGIRVDKSNNIPIRHKLKRAGAIEVDFVPHSFYNYNTVFDNSFDPNVFEMWFYSDGLLRARGLDDFVSYKGIVAGNRAKVKYQWDMDERKHYLFVDDVLVDEGSMKVTDTGDYTYLNGHSNTRGDNTYYSIKIWDYDELVFFEDFSDREVRNRHVKKASVKKYPFNFSRESIEMVDRVRYGLNQPRVKNGGFMIEEETENLTRAVLDPTFESYSVGITSVVTNQLSGGYQPEISDDFGFKTLKTTGGRRTYHYVTGMNEGDWLTLSADVYSTDAGKASIGFEMNGGGYSWKGANSEKHQGTGWERLTVTFPEALVANSTAYFFFYHDYAPNPVHWKNVQLERKTFASSFTEFKRPLEKLDIPVTFDGYAGSIEINFEFEDISKVRYIFDSNNNRWLIYGAGSSFNVFLNGSHRLTIPRSSLKIGRNKVAISWKETLSEVAVNGEVVGTGAHNGGSSSNMVYIGRRYTDVEVYGNVIYSFVVKDRTGKITYSF